jgi:hypothetical protein
MRTDGHEANSRFFAILRTRLKIDIGLLNIIDYLLTVTFTNKLSRISHKPLLTEFSYEECVVVKDTII